MTSETTIVAGPERIGTMTTRERFVRTMHYQAVDRVPHMEFGYWASLKDRWMAEGHLPKEMDVQGSGEISNTEVEVFFGCEQRTGVGPAIHAGPHRPHEIVEERDGKVIYRDGIGILCEEVQGGHPQHPSLFGLSDQGPPHVGEFPRRVPGPRRRVARRERKSGSRIAPGSMRESNLPVGINFGSFIGRIRDWIGFEDLAYLSYDDPDLLAEMVAHMPNSSCRYLPPLLEKVEFDFATGWEDICFNSGPLLSPKVFQERHHAPTWCR